MTLDEKSQKLGELFAVLSNAHRSSAEAIDAYLNYLGKPQDPEHRDVYERLNWENRTGDKGPFQMLRKDNCNDTQLFSHLDAVLKQNNNNVTIGAYHYWAGEQGYIFRRKRKNSK